MNRPFFLVLVFVLYASPAFAQDWTKVPYDPANFSGSSGMTWSVPKKFVSSYEYKMLDANTMVINFSLKGGTVGGTPGRELRLKIPGGYRNVTQAMNMMAYYDNWNEVNTTRQGVGTVGCSALEMDYLQLRKLDNRRWTLADGTNYVFGQIILHVRPPE